MKEIVILFVFSVVISCSKSDNVDERYLYVINELHRIECEHLRKENKTVSNKAGVYKFREEAFFCIMKNTDRRVLAIYEDLHSEAAHILYNLNDNDKMKYKYAEEKIYSESCP